MAEFKAKTADGRGLTFDISGPSPTPQEQAEINAHIQNYNRLFPTYTQAAPVPAEEELGPWGAGWRGLYADTQSMAAGILQGLGAPEMAQRFEEDANRVRRETAERYKPLAFSDINNLSDVGTFAYQAGVGSLPYMIPGLIGGGIAGLGARALGGAAATYAPAAAAAGYAGATAPTRIGGIASRMAEEQGTTLSQIDWGKAVATGAASTALDLVTPQVLGVFGKFAGAAKVGDEIATGAINSWWKSLPKNVIKAAGTEAGTETAQQAMEIWAANPEKFYELGPDVREELITAAVAGGLLGPIFEVATGGFAAEQSALAKAREKRRKAQEALDALIVQGDAANAEQIRQLREDYSKALAEEKAFSESDQADVPFGPDTPRYRPSDDMGRYRAEVIVSDQGTPAGYRVAGPTGESIAEDYPSFDAARMAAQVLNDSAPHSPSIMESYPVIPTSSLSASTREALVKKRFELGQAGLEANTSMTEIRNLLGDAIATLERERLTGSPDIPLQARMVAQSSPASTSVTPNIPPPAAPASAPAPTPAAPAVAPTVAPEKKKAAKTLKPRTKVVKAPVEVNPETATPTPQQPSAVPTEPDLNAMTDDELEAYLAEGAGEFTFRPGELGQQEDPDFARRKRGKQAAEATVNAAEQRPAPTGPRFTVQPIDATVAAPEGVPSGTLFEIFKDGKVIGSSSDLAQAQERARKILQKSPTASVRVRPKGRAYAVNEYRGSANGDVFVSTVRTFRDKAEADTYADTLNKMREERAQKRATNRAIIKRYEDLVAKQQAVVQRLMNRLRDLGMPENFRLLIRGVLQDPTKAVEDINIDAAGDTGIEGYYDAAAKTIAFAMDLYDPNLNEDQLYAKLVGVINHEFVHALQRAGSFTPAEWKVITKYLKSNQAYGRDGEKIPGQTWWERAEQMYGAQDQERVAREAMSEAFRSWARERKSVTGKPAGIFRRIVEMLKSLGRFGKTTPRVEQIFTEINAGKRSGVLKQGIPADAKAIDFSGRKVTPASFFDMKELAGWVEEAEARPSQTAIVKMTPDQFLDLATHGARDRAYFDKYAEKIDRGMKLSSVMSLRLKVESDGTLRIEGHEGRHRANAIKRLGYDEVPVKIFLTSDQAKVHNISEILSAPVKVIGQPPMRNEVDLDLRPFTRDDLQAAAVEPLRLSVGIAPVQTRIGLEKDQSPEALSRLVESGSDDARAQSRAVTEAMKEFSRPIAEAAKKGGARVYNTAGVGAYMNYDAEVSSGVAAVYDPDTKVSAINDVVAETFRLAREHDQYDAFVAINRGPSFSGPSARPSMTIWLNTQAGFDNHNRDVTSLTRIRDFLSRVRTENVAGFSIFRTQAQRGIEGGYEGITFVWVPEYANVTPENFDQNLVDTIREMDEVAKAIKDLNLGSITYTNYELILGSSTGPDSYETAAAGFIRDSANAGNFGEGRPVGRSVRDSVARRAQGVEQAQPSDNVGSVPARGELDEQALEDARAKYDVPAEVKKPNGDIDFSKRTLILVPIEIKKRKYRSDAEFSVKMVGSGKEIGELRGHVSSKKPNTFQVDWASFDPDDMTIPETYGLIGLLLKHFPNVRRIVGYRISGAKFENRARRIRVAQAVAERAQVRFAENLMMRAQDSSNPVERSFFEHYLGSPPDLIYSNASRQVPELFDELNESKIAYLDASEVLFQLQSMDQTQVIDVGRLIDRGAIDFSRRLVNTPEFKAWFKDSKVVNPDGSPRIVFHNTAASEDFSSFRTSSRSFGAHFGTPIQANYFGKSRNYIDNRILPVFLSIQNPVRVRDLGAWPVFTVLSELKRAGAISESDLENIDRAIPDQTKSGVADPEASVTDMYSPELIAAQRELIKLGIDGLVYLNRVEGLSAYSLDKANEAAGNLGRELTDDEFRALVPEARDSYIAFRPTQIKSALGNRGTFSSEDPRIDFSRRKAVIKVVEKKKVEKLSRDERMEALAENFKRRPDLFEVASNVYGETLYIKKEITNAVPGIHDIIPFLRPDEIGLTNAKGAQSIMEMFTTVPSTEEMAAVAISGRAKRGWYERSAKALIDIFGPKDAPRFSALLAAMSPQSSVESNAKNAINMWVNWDRAGRPTDTKRILQIMGKSVQGKKGEKSALDSWKPNTLTALQTIDPHAITISGNKVNSFMLNLNDVVHAVTNDAWMANYGGVAQDKFTGPSYHGYSAKVRMAADAATQITGYKWTPREIQETIWSWSKTIYELRKKRGKGGGNETVGDLLKAGNVTNDMISKTPDFATLFADGVYRNILESGGYGTQIERIMSDERIEGRGGQADVALGDASIYDAEGTGIDERTYRRFLDTAAGRLEALYQRRKAEAAAKRARGEKLSEDGDDAEIDYSRRVTSTLEFQDWFGLSKVVDANGDPIIVYHGTSKDNDFSAFNIPRNGAWFTASPDEASAYAKENDSRKLVLGEGFRYIEKNTADRVLPVYLRIENPYKFTDADRDSLNNQPDRRDTGTAYRRWQAEFFDKLRREGYDGVDMGYGTWVVIGEPNQIKSAIGNNGKFDPTKKRIDYSRRTMPVTPADIANAVDRLRYTKVRNGIARALRGVTIAGKRIGLSDEAAMGTSRSFLENFADHALPLGEIVDFVRENKGSIPDAFDAYLAQQVWSSEATDHINRTNDRLYNPLVRSIQNIKISDAEYNDFKKRFPSLAKVVEVAGDRRLGMLNALLYARHAPERNVIMNIMNEGKLPAGSGVPTPEAEAATKWFESRGDWPKYRQAEGIIRQIVEETNKIRVEYGLTPDFKNIPPPEVFKKAGMPGGYKFYVPLRGMIEEDMMPNDIDLQRLRTGLGFKIKGKEDLTAMGRDTLAKSVAEHVILQNEVSIVRAHKNKVGRSFYDLVANNQNILLGIARIVEKAPLVRRVGDDGIVRLMVDPNYMNSDRFFVTKINGENKVVEIFDKRLARTLNGSTGYGSDAANQIINFIGGFTRLMSQLATGLNPEFWIRNTPRDVALAAVNLNQFEIPGLDATFMRNWPGAFKTARRANRFDWNFVKAGEERVPSGAEPDDILYNEFLEDGGFTGYLGLQSIETRIADLNKQITKGEEQGLQKGLEVGKRFAQFVEAINNTFENSTRFAVYKSLRESGFTRQRAAQGAKTITTNFNAGGWLKNMINPFYMFYNASLQGTLGILTALGRSKRVQKIAGSIMIAGFLQDLLMASLSDEDDTGALKYDGLKEHILRTHMVFADPTGMSGDGYIKVPMPYGYNAIFNFGRVVAKYIRHQATGGDYDLGKAIGSAVGTLADATNPLGATNSFMNFAAPTFLDPVVDLTTNRDFADRTIVKRPFGVGVDLPSSQLHLNSTSPTFVSIAEWLNSVSGGTDVMPGAIDFSPDAMQYLYDYFLSGAGAFVRRSFDLTTQGLPAALQGDFDAIQMSEVPMARALITRPAKVDMERYMNIRDEVMRIGKEAQEASRQSDMQRLENVREKYQKQLQVYGVVKAADSQRASINKRLAAIRENEKLTPEAKTNLIKQLKDQEEAAMIRAIRAYNFTVEGMSVPGMEQ